LIEYTIGPIVNSIEGDELPFARRREEKAMSIFTRFNSMIQVHRARRAHARTAMYVASLPLGMQKDIGWPDSDGFSPEVREHRFAATQTPQS